MDCNQRKEQDQNKPDLSELKKEINTVICENVHKSETGDGEEERKPTQTDHLNKKLLSAFLCRINNSDNSIAFGLQHTQNQEHSGPEEQDFSS